MELAESTLDKLLVTIISALPFGAPGCCPASAIKDWLSASGINEGPLFRPVNRWDHVQPRSLNPGAINDLLKTLGYALQFDFVPELSSHSFRRGLSTSAARERVDFELIKKQGGWQNDATVWGYIEEGQQFNQNAALVLMKQMEKMLSRS